MEPQELLFLGFPPSVVVELLKTYAVLMNSDGNESYYKAGVGSYWSYIIYNWGSRAKSFSNFC